MYRIDRSTNTIQALKQVSFRDLGFRERAHLQEWIAQQPAALGEDLLIIQKEFGGFSDTNERLDLLALDKQGSLVIIENKLDDTGRDVTWQALKYASYCSAFSKDDVRRVFQDHLAKCGDNRSAEEVLSAFFDDIDYSELALNKGVSQRIILVAANFRKEVTSTVLWLSNFRVRIQCFRATPYVMGDELILNVEQIIPTPDTEDFVISLADKAKDEIEGIEAEARRHPVRRRFWADVLRAMNASSSDLFRNISPSKDSWIAAASGVRGISFNFSATQTYCRSEVYIDRGDKDENEAILAHLRALHGAGESSSLLVTWEPLETKRACRIKIERPANVFEQEDWPEMVRFMIDGMQTLENAFRPHLTAAVNAVN